MNRNNLEHWRKRIVEGKPPRHYPPACPTCGATLPHDNPMALQFHDQQEQKQLFNEAVRRATALGRPFEESEVFAFIWDLGYELTPTMNDRFVLVKEATGTSRRLWGLRLCLHCYERQPTVNNTYCEPCAKQLGKEYMQNQEGTSK